MRQATVQFDDGTGECLVHAEGSCVLVLLNIPLKGPVWRVLRDTIEAGCRQYGTVHYDSYFSHWNRIDLLNNSKYDDDPAIDEGDADLSFLPSAYATGCTGKERTNSDEGKSNDAKGNRTVNNNFYQILSPAHREEKIGRAHV